MNRSLFWNIACLTVISVSLALRLHAGTGTSADPYVNGQVTYSMDGGNKWYEINDGNAYSLTSAGVVYVGYSNSGNHFTIKNGSDVTTPNNFYIGTTASSTGNYATVTGEGSSLISQSVCIGTGGSGTLEVLDGASASFSSTFQMGNYDSGSGNVIVSGASTAGVASTLTITNANDSTKYSYIGRCNGTNSITISDGGVMQYTSSGSLVFVSGPDTGHATSNITVTGVNSTSGTASRLYANGTMYLGYVNGTGTLSVTDGGRAEVTGVLWVDDYANSTGIVTVSGVGSLLSVGTLNCDANPSYDGFLSKVELLDGGLLKCGSISPAGNDAEMYFNGGYLAVSGELTYSDVYTLLSGGGSIFAYDPVSGDYIEMTETNYTNYLSVLYYGNASGISSDLEGSFTVVTSLYTSYASVPEPATCALLGGLTTLGMVVLRKRRTILSDHCV